MAKPRCPLCGNKRMAGVMDYVRLAKDGVTEERLLERCDTCARYDGDAEAAIHWATRFGGRLRYDQRAVVWTPDTVAAARRGATGSEVCRCVRIGTLQVPDATCPEHGDNLRRALEALSLSKEVA